MQTTDIDLSDPYIDLSDSQKIYYSLLQCYLLEELEEIPFKNNQLKKLLPNAALLLSEYDESYGFAHSDLLKILPFSRKKYYDFILQGIKSCSLQNRFLNSFCHILNAAAKDGYTEIITLLHQHGITVNNTKNNALYQAVKYADIETITCLLEYGADVNKRNEDISELEKRNSPLGYALFIRAHEIVLLLLLCGANYDKIPEYHSRRLQNQLTVINIFKEIHLSAADKFTLPSYPNAPLENDIYMDIIHSMAMRNEFKDELKKSTANGQKIFI